MRGEAYAPKALASLRERITAEETPLIVAKNAPLT
jgi:hypothetical protein